MYLSRKEIEKISKDIIAEYMQLPKVKIQKEIHRIDPFILAENLLGLTVDFQILSEDKMTFGLTSYYATIVPVLNDNNEAVIYPLDGKTILIEKDLAFDEMNGKFDFTIVHESSHHILRRLYPKDYGVQIKNTGVHYYRDERPTEIKDWDEWQASVLASALLMPEDLLRSNMELVGLGDKMQVLNRKYRQEDFFKFCNLAVKMGVSLTALRIRMNCLGLIEKDYYYKPYRMFDIEY